jgi:CubicO group peptidase (beta-lactamase class C family)
MGGWTHAMVGAGIVLACGCATTAAPTVPANAAIDAEARRLMASEDVKGMALAVIDEGRIIHVAAYGFRNVEKQLPLTVDTVMYGASLTKAAFAYYTLQLVDEGKVDLDAPIGSMLSKPLPAYENYGDLVGDERWEKLTPRTVLNHATGFANFRWLEDDGKLRFHRAPGERYGYSGEGFYVLQMAIEEELGVDLGEEMQKRIFTPFGMTRTSMEWRPDFAENLADGYDIDGKFIPHDERSRPSAAGSMDTTIADQAQMWAAMVRGDRLSDKSRGEWVRPQLPIGSRRQFPTLRDWTDARGPQIGLAAGLGVIVFDDPSGRMFYKGGHDDGTGNTVVCQDRRKRCIVLLANSVRAEKIYPALVKFVLGETAAPWWWEYGLD